MGKFEDLKRLRESAAKSIKEVDSFSKAVDATRAAAESAASEAKIVNRQGGVSKWRVAKAAARPTKTGRRLVKGALAGAVGAAAAGNPGASAAVPEARASISNTFIGRKFSSSLSVNECLENFSIAARRCYQPSSEAVAVEWSAPENVASVVSTQGGPAATPPALFVAQDLADGGRLYLAIWDGYVWNGGDGVNGRAREMWFVPPGFDNSPIPIAGTWKNLDGSLSSIGTVESAFWGV